MFIDILKAFSENALHQIHTKGDNVKQDTLQKVRLNRTLRTAPIQSKASLILKQYIWNTFGLTSS